MITTRPMALTHCFKLEVFFTLISVKSSEQSAKQSRLQMVFKMSTVSVHTLSHSSTLLITMLFWYSEKCVNVDARGSNIDINK